MIDTNLRGNFQKAFDKSAKVLKLSNLHPNHITILALICGIVSAIFIAYDMMLVALSLLWVSGLLDVLDGTVARLTGKSSKLGAYLDMIFDRMVEAAVILGFYFLMPQHALVYLLFFIGVIFNFTTFMLAGNLFNNTSNKSMHYDVGILERTETFLMFTLLMLLPSFTFYILILFNSLLFLTGIIRMYRIIKFERENAL